MSAFGDTFCLTLLTNDPGLASRGDQAGVNRIGVDLERLGKAERQVGEDTRLSEHSWEDLAKIAQCLAHAALFVRLNPLNENTSEEINTSLQYGARVLMLPFFRTADEVSIFVHLVDRRAYVVVLLETAAAAVRIRNILEVPGVNEIMLGLNDLRLQFGVSSHFEVLVSPLVDVLASEIRGAGVALSLGGIARVNDSSLPIPPDLVYAQYPRLRANGAWLSRSFFRSLPPEFRLDEAIIAVRRRLNEWAEATSEALERAREDLAGQVRGSASGAALHSSSGK